LLYYCLVIVYREDKDEKKLIYLAGHVTRSHSIRDTVIGISRFGLIFPVYCSDHHHEKYNPVLMMWWLIGLQNENSILINL